MNTHRIYLRNGSERAQVDSLASALVYDRLRVTRMQARRVPIEERADCRWLGCGIAKGVTHPEKNLSVMAAPGRLRRGLHGELIRGFRDIRVDPIPLCYDNYRHRYGFGGFVRWVYFAPADGSVGFIGVDWSNLLRPTGGVAHSMKRATETFLVLKRHGVDARSEAILLGCRMTEHRVLRTWRNELGLVMLADWCKNGERLFCRKSPFCPRCGTKAIKPRSERFCSFCGCERSRVLAS